MVSSPPRSQNDLEASIAFHYHLVFNSSNLTLTNWPILGSVRLWNSLISSPLFSSNPTRINFKAPTGENQGTRFNYQMLKLLICGSFHNQEDDGERWSSPVSAPTKSRKSSKYSKNPYSARGLDKFSELVDDLNKKREEIHSRVGPEDVYVVRFKYSNANKIVPVVIKLKDRKQDKSKATGDIKENKPIIQDTEASDKLPIEAQSPEKDVKQSRPVEADRKTEEEKKKKKSIWDLNLLKLRRPAYYVPVFIVLILLFLVFFGRSVAILCTSVGWYILPTLGSKTPTTKKKQYRRGFSEITMASGNGLFSPKSKNNGAVKSKSFQVRRASSPPG